MSAEHFDVVVVGSGFGGSVTSCRLAEAGLKVCLFERGRAYPPGSFARTQHGVSENFWDPSEGRYGMFNLWTFTGLEALVSSGLGGGSLIYANVLLRKPRTWFVEQQAFPGGVERWPVTYDDLEPHYERVEKRMHVQRYPFETAPYDQSLKTKAMKQAAERLGLAWELPNLAVTFGNDGETPVPGEPIKEPEGNIHGRTRYTCRLCGECDVGCNYGSKNTLDYTYLSAAQRAGADIRTLSEVKAFAPRAEGGFTIEYVTHDPAKETTPPPRHTVTADRLILSAGTLGSTFLLLKNRAAFPRLSDRLGTRFCGNGDLLTFAMKCNDRAQDPAVPYDLGPTYGPVITSTIRVDDEIDGGDGRGFYVQDAGYPAFATWLVEATNVVGTVRRILRMLSRRFWAALRRDAHSDMSEAVANALGDCRTSRTSLPLLGMGRDVPDGTFTLRDGKYLACDWHMKSSKPYFDRVCKTMGDITEAWGGTFVPNPTYNLSRVISVHPLGGCPMSTSSEHGVVDEWGEVHGHPGLYVADGSVMPGPVGPNPSLTIAALADRTADRILGQLAETASELAHH